MKKLNLFFLLMFVLLLTSFTSALLDSNTEVGSNNLNGLQIYYPHYDHIKQGQTFNLTVFTTNKTDGLNLLGSSCSTQIYNHSGALTYNNANLTSLGDGYNVLIPTSNFTINEEYNLKIICVNGAIGDAVVERFTVNGTGFEFTTARAIFYIAMLCLLGFLFILNGVGIAKLPRANPRSDAGKILSISKLKYLTSVLFVFGWGLIVSILLIASSIAQNYLGDQSIGGFLFKLFKLPEIFMYPALILWVIYIILNLAQDFEISKLFDRGYDPR